MASKIIVLATVLAACNAVPIWYNELPGVIMRIGRSPSISYGFGSGFSSNIDGISHSTGFGSSFQSGGGQAYGSGLGYTDGNGYARGVGVASSGNTHPVYYQPAYQVAPRYESAVSSAQSSGTNNFGSAVSSAQSSGPSRFNSAVSSAQNLNGFGTALSSANNGFGSALSSANSGFGSSVSSAQTRDAGLGYGSAVAAAHNIGGVGASTAQTARQGPGGFQHSGATSINNHGLQAAHSHAVNSGFY